MLIEEIPATDPDQELARLMLQTVTAWGGNQSTLELLKQRRTLNRVGHLLLTEEHGIREITAPFYLKSGYADNSTIYDLMALGVEIDDPIFKEGSGRGFDYKKDFTHNVMNFVSGAFTLIKFANHKGLDLAAQIQLLSVLGYHPAQLRMAPAFVTAVNSKVILNLETTYGNKKYRLFGSQTKNDTSAVPVLERRDRLDDKSGPWHIGLVNVSAVTYDQILLVTPANRVDPPMRLPGPGFGLTHQAYDRHDDRSLEQQGLK